MPNRKPVSSLRSKVVSPKVSWDIHRTRYPELGYQQVDTNLWRFVDMTTIGNANIGGGYPTRAELLADLPRYAYEFGCEGAPPPPLRDVARQVRATVINECIGVIQERAAHSPSLFDRQTCAVIVEVLTQLRVR